MYFSTHPIYLLTLSLLNGYIYVGDKRILLVAICGCWWRHFDTEDIFCMLGREAFVKTIADVGDKTSLNRHQHLKAVANTFHLHHPSPTFVRQSPNIPIFTNLLLIFYSFMLFGCSPMMNVDELFLSRQRYFLTI